MPFEWILFVATCLWITVNGVKNIRARIRLPAHMPLVEVPDSEISPGIWKDMQALDAAMREIHYFPVRNQTAPTLQGRNIGRVYHCASDTSVASATFLTPLKGRLNAYQYVEFSARFEDGRRLNTRNALLADLFGDMPGQLKQHCPPSTSVRTLKERHDRVREEWSKTGRAVDLKTVDFSASQDQYHQQFLANGLKAGLLRAMPDASYGATTKLALRGVRNYFNPLSGAGSIAEAVVGLSACAVLPAAWVWALGQPEAIVLLLPYVGGWGVSLVLARLALALAAYAAVGWFMGAHFGNKHFIWGFFIAALPLGLLEWLRMPTPVNGMTAGLVVSVVSQTVHFGRMRKKALEIARSTGAKVPAA